MYRGQEPAFCRGCGVKWTPGAADCAQCGEPARARPAGDGFGRKLPAFTRQLGLVRALSVLTLLYALMLLLELATGWSQRAVLLELAQGREVGVEAAALLDRHVWTTLGSVVAYLGAIVLFGVWVVRAGRNLRARGILDTRDIDEARILWFFVPGVHLYRPLIGMRELWRGSWATDPGEWRSTRVPACLGVWWAVWLASNALGNAAWLMAYDEGAPRELLTATELDLGRIAARLLCVPLFLAVVWGIERAQARHGRATEPARTAA